MTIVNADEYCAEIARKSGSSFFYSFKLLPAEKRTGMYTLYAFFRHTDDIVDEAAINSSSDRSPASALDQWQQEFERCCDGRPQHPITISLRNKMDRFGIQRMPFDKIIEGVRMDLEKTSYSTFADLYEYCFRVAAAPGMACINILGRIGDRSEMYAENLGLALQLTNIIRDVGEDAARGRIYLPGEDLERFGCRRTDIREAKSTPSFIAMMRFQSDRARSYFQKAREILRREDRRTVLCPEIMSSIYQALLTKIENTNFDVLARRIRIPTTKKLLLALGVYAKSL